MFKKKIIAPMTGRAVALSGVPDEVFSTGMLGEGIAIEPEDGEIRAPADGRVETIADSLHAYTLITDDGLEILVHVGIDTVSLGGSAFCAKVKCGDRVRAGDVIAEADLAAIRAAGCSTVTPVLITNPDALRKIDLLCGETKAGKTPIINYK